LSTAEVLAAAMSGRPLTHFDPSDPVNPVDLIEEARRDDLLPLIARGLRRTGDASWAESLRREAHDVAGRQAALEHFQRLELVRLLDGLAAAGVRPLLMKGAALAYTVYPDSSLRPHNDVDLFVCDDHRHRASRALPSLGYTEGCQGGGDLSFSQAHFGFLDRYGVRHTCDLHWRIANPLAFRNMVTFEECEAAAIAIPRLSPYARTFGLHHAMFISCVHRVAHHLDRDMLLWIYDIHLLVSAAADGDLERFRELAMRARAGAVCARGLDAAVRYFQTPVPASLLSSLRGGAARDEPSSAFLTGGLRLVDLLREDLAALPGWRSRLSLIGEHLFPKVGYMRDAYAPGSRWPLPFLYVSRILRGTPKWFRRS